MATPPPALHRGLACLIGILGTLMATKLSLLLLGLLAVLVFLAVQKKLHEFVRFGWIVLLPIGGILIFIWGFVRRGEPGGEQSVEGGILFAVLTTLRLALLGGIFLTTVLALSPERLTHLLRTFGIRRQTLAVVLSYLNLWSDFRYHVRQVYVARCARGLMPDRRFVTRMWQLPYVVRTLFISALTYSIDRSKMWRSNDRINRLDRLNKNAATTEECSRFAGFLLLTLSITWAITSMIYFFQD